MFNLQVSDVKRLLVDVGSVRSSSQSGHGCQVATVAAHRLNDEDAPLGSAGRLLDAVTCLTRAWKPVSVGAHGLQTAHVNMYVKLTNGFSSHDALIRLRTVAKTSMPAHNLHKKSTCNAGTLRPECCPPVGTIESCTVKCLV